MRLAFLACAAALLSLCAPGRPAYAGTVAVSNSIYRAHIEVDSPTPDSVGSWNAVTAATHPDIPGRDILYSGSLVRSNFSSLRVYDPSGSTTDYTFDYQGDPFAPGIWMDSLVTSNGPNATWGSGWTTNWDATADSLRIAQDVFITGTTVSNSAIYYTVEITNYGAESKAVGWRNLLDWALTEAARDDGPANSIRTAAGATLVGKTATPFSWTPGSDDYVEIESNAASPSYRMYLGLGYDPKLSVLATTSPDEYAYVDFEAARETNFDYAPDPNLPVRRDRAGLIWWGRTASSAITLDQGESVRFTHAIFGFAPSVGGRVDPAALVPLPAAAWAGLGLLALLGFVRRFGRREIR